MRHCRGRCGLPCPAGMLRPRISNPGSPCRLSFPSSLASGFEGITVRLVYRHVNQGEYYQTQEMQREVESVRSGHSRKLYEITLCAPILL